VCIVEFTGHLLSDRDTTSCTGMGAGVNGNKTRLNLGLGMGMGINHCEWEGMGLKKIFPLISSVHACPSEPTRRNADALQTIKLLSVFRASPKVLGRDVREIKRKIRYNNEMICSLVMC